MTQMAHSVRVILSAREKFLSLLQNCLSFLADIEYPVTWFGLKPWDLYEFQPLAAGGGNSPAPSLLLSHTRLPGFGEDPVL